MIPRRGARSAGPPGPNRTKAGGLARESGRATLPATGFIRYALAGCIPGQRSTAIHVTSRVLLGDDGPRFELILGPALGGAVACLARRA